MLIPNHAVAHCTIHGVHHTIRVHDHPNTPYVTVTPHANEPPNVTTSYRRTLNNQVRRLIPRIIVLDPDEPPLSLKWHHDTDTGVFTSLLDSRPKPPPHMRHHNSTDRTTQP